LNNNKINNKYEFEIELIIIIFEMKDENVKNMGSVRDGEFTGKVYRVYKIISPIG
jgi:hypothetical protein